MKSDPYGARLAHRAPESAPPPVWRSQATVLMVSGCGVGAVVAEECVGEDEELSHDGDDGDLGLFAGGAETVSEGGEGRIEASCDEGGHVEGGADGGPAGV